MSILIKGMEMPTSCSVCPMLEGDRMDGLCHAASRWLDDDEYWTWYVYPEGDVDDSKPCNCPLVPVPPHGDLIDADKLVELCDIMADKCDGIGASNWHQFKTTVEWSPIVIPASEEGE